jgi:hypothetical protein
MISGIFHLGSGLGNQLFRFVGSKCLALDRGEEHAMIAPELFKGKDFMTLPINDAKLDYSVQGQTGKVIVDDLKGITIVDAEFQSEADFMHRIDEVRTWLKVERLEMPDDLCVISRRGGEYTLYTDLYLSNEYWGKAIKMMLEINPNMRFEVETDDPLSASLQFPTFSIIKDIGHNWRAIRYAKYLIVGNSSFSILPSLVNEDVKKIIAPKFHAGHNKGYWQEPNNCYNRYTYV